MFTDISNPDKLSDYIPIFAAALIVDMLVSTFSCVVLKADQLKRWYKTFTLGAIISDVFIIAIVILIARYLYPLIFKEWSLWKFILLTLVLQIIHDFLFYGLFSIIPRGASGIMDVFKDYAAAYGGWAIVADSVLIVGSILLASYLAGLEIGTNLFILVIAVYLIPYFIYSF